jgi:hypothetical protein
MIGLVGIYAYIVIMLACGLILSWRRDRPSSLREFLCGPRDER